MKRILVAAAVIRREDRILIAQRPLDRHMGGLWEFPGGKVEADESLEQALVRELEEELGVTPQQFRPLIRITHDYPDKAICLDVWEISAFAGEAHGCEGQAVRWVTADELTRFEFPAANRPIVTAARLPAHYFITPDDRDEAGLLEWLDAALHKKARLVLLRAPQLDPDRYRVLAQHFQQRCRAAHARLMLHGAPALTMDMADGIHLPFASLRQFGQLPELRGRWLAASVHDQAELEIAERLGVDFVTLSPVRETLSHPGAPALGWEAFAGITHMAHVPVYALGGMRGEDLARAWQAGAQGVAGIRGL